MNTIDHRILIPAPPGIVWNFVSNLANNPIWQVDCKSIAFLTTTHAGQGTRYRFTSENRREQVVEITAWYNQLGYEYVIIDGTSFTQNKGRIRLQEIAEGTIVEWTFNYEIGGIFSGLRNTLSTRRNVENTIVDSLWTLWRHIGQMQNDPDYHAKSLMRDAPDVEQRASYQPRHPSIVESSGKPIQTFDNTNGIQITEPPIKQDDTRPRPTIPDQPATPSPAPTSDIQETVKEPDFLSGLSTSEMAEVKRQDANAVTNIDSVNVSSSDQDSDVTFKPPTTPITEPPVTVDDTSPNEALSPVKDQTEKPAPSNEFVLTRFDDEAIADDAETETLPKPQPFIDEPEISETDTSNVSVFDLFGVTKPSESQEIPVVEVEENLIPSSETVDSTPNITDAPPVKQPDTQPQISEAVAPQPSVDPEQPVATQKIVISKQRTGQRLILRQRLVNLRRPE